MKWVLGPWRGGKWVLVPCVGRKGGKYRIRVWGEESRYSVRVGGEKWVPSPCTGGEESGILVCREGGN